MAGLFSNKQSSECPIAPETRLWMENAFLWLAGQFGRDNIAQKKMLLPIPEHFPISYDGTKDYLTKTAEIVALQMEIDISDITLEFYEQNTQEFSGDFGHRVWTQVDNESDEKLSAGLFFGKNEKGNYEIFVEMKNLNDPENLVATLAHEFAHIKLLGEKDLNSMMNH